MSSARRRRQQGRQVGTLRQVQAAGRNVKVGPGRLLGTDNLLIAHGTPVRHVQVRGQDLGFAEAPIDLHCQPGLLHLAAEGPGTVLIGQQGILDQLLGQGTAALKGHATE